MPRPLDHALELDASLMGRRKAHEFVEAGIEPRGIGFQGRVGEPFSSPPDPAGSAQQMPKLGREDVVAGVDGILHGADEMGEADLIVHGCPAHLPAIAVRHPEIGPEVRKEIRHHSVGAGGCGDEKGAVVMMENPQPPVLLADPQAGLVGLQDQTIEGFCADRRGRLGKGILCRVEDVDERALADVETEEIGQESSQALEGDALGEAQIDDEGAQVRPKGRAFWHVLRRLRLEFPGAA